jgi:hypothetical protein
VRKYRNEPVVVDGIRFDSKGEAFRWFELQLLQRAGKISTLTRQEKFPVVINGKKICSYIADFTYFDGAKRVVEDFKSPVTAAHPMFRLKKKLVEALNPGLEIQVVTSKGKAP